MIHIFPDDSPQEDHAGKSKTVKTEVTGGKTMGAWIEEHHNLSVPLRIFDPPRPSPLRKQPIPLWRGRNPENFPGTGLRPLKTAVGNKRVRTT